MKCYNCGNSVENGVKICPYCGESPYNPVQKFVNNINKIVITGGAILTGLYVLYYLVCKGQ